MHALGRHVEITGHERGVIIAHRQQRRQRAGVRQVAVRERALRDLVAEHLAARAADQVGHHVRAQRRDQRDEQRRHQPAADAGQEHAPERAERPGPQVTRRLEQPEVELLGRRVDRQDGERQLGVDEHEQHRPRVVEQLRVRRDQVQRHQQVLDRTLGVQQDFPREDAHEEAGPERHDHGQQQRVLPAPRRTRHEVRHRRGQQQAERGGEHRQRDRAPQDRRVVRIAQAAQRLQRPAVPDAAIGIRGLEGHREHDRRRRQEQRHEPREGRQRDPAFVPPVEQPAALSHATRPRAARPRPRAAAGSPSCPRRAPRSARA